MACLRCAGWKDWRVVTIANPRTFVCALERAPSSVVMPRLDRGTQYAAASRFITAASGILGRPVKPDDDSCGRGAEPQPSTAVNDTNASRRTRVMKPLAALFAIAALPLPPPSPPAPKGS